MHRKRNFYFTSSNLWIQGVLPKWCV